MDASSFPDLAENEESHWWYVSRRRVVLALLEREDWPEGARILDIGAGTGGMTAALSRFGPAEALEVNPAAWPFLEQRDLAALHTRPLPDPELPSASYHLISAFDVLEHIDDDVSVVTDIARLLVPGGRFVATVPAHPWLWSRHDEHYHHRRRYTREGLASALTAGGLEVEFLSPWLSLLFPLFLADRVRQRLRPPTRVATRAPSGPLNQVLAAVNRVESRWIGRRLPTPLGASWVVLARRPRAT